MTTMNQESWNDRDEQFENNENATNRSGNPISNGSVSDLRLAADEYNLDDDEDDQNLSDDDVTGRDLDIDGGDEWDEDNVSESDLDADDLADNDEANAELHGVRNDKFGSLTSYAQNGPDPDEIPEEHNGGSEFNQPNGDQMEQANNNEINYNEPNEVTPPSPESEPKTSDATLNNLDPTFTDTSHDRQSKRIVDHDPGAGSTTGEHGAYNL